MIKTLVIASVWTLILLATVAESEVRNTKPAAAKESAEKLTSNELLKTLPSDLSRIGTRNFNSESHKNEQLANEEPEIVGASSDLFSALRAGPEFTGYYEPMGLAEKNSFLQNMPLAGQLRRIDQINQALEASQSMNRKLNKPTNFLNPSPGRQMAAATGQRSNYNAVVNDRFFQDETGPSMGAPSGAGPFVNTKLAKSASTGRVGGPLLKTNAASPVPSKTGAASEQADSEDYAENAGEVARADAAEGEDVFAEDQPEEPLAVKANQRQTQTARVNDEDEDGEQASGADDSSESATSQRQARPDEEIARRPLKGIEDSNGLFEAEQQLEQPSNMKARKSTPEVELYTEASKSGAHKAPVSDLQVAAGHHHKHHHGHYYMYAEVPKKKAWKMGFKRGNHKHMIARHEKGYKNKFHSSFKWDAKEKCKKKGKCHSHGKMTWHYEHHDKKKKKHHY